MTLRRITRDRRLSQEEASKYREVRERVDEELPELIARHHDLSSPSDEESGGNMGKPTKREYDFSRGDRGKFYRPDAKFNMPIYLDQDVLAYLNEKATAKGIEVSQLINEILRRDIDLIETVK